MPSIYFEQSRTELFQALDKQIAREREQLDSMMRLAFDQVYDTAQKYSVPLQIGAYIMAIDKVANAPLMRGIHA